jgi:hypothetical protein
VKDGIASIASNVHAGQNFLESCLTLAVESRDPKTRVKDILVRPAGAGLQVGQNAVLRHGFQPRADIEVEHDNAGDFARDHRPAGWPQVRMPALHLLEARTHLLVGRPFDERLLVGADRYDAPAVFDRGRHNARQALHRHGFASHQRRGGNSDGLSWRPSGMVCLSRNA